MRVESDCFMGLASCSRQPQKILKDALEWVNMQVINNAYNSTTKKQFDLKIDKGLK